MACPTPGAGTVGPGCSRDEAGNTDSGSKNTPLKALNMSSKSTAQSKWGSKFDTELPVFIDGEDWVVDNEGTELGEPSYEDGPNPPRL